MGYSWTVWPSIAIIFVAFFVMINQSRGCMNIEACSHACKRSDQKMIRYNEQDGCICSEKINE